jgi:predicted DCC family thiol-disulfide oxidoreductase YuxK
MATIRPLMIFDGDCAICSSSARVLRKMTKDRIAIEPYQFLKLSDYGLTESDTSKAVYYISDKTYVANRAIAQFLIDSKTIWGLAGRLINLPGMNRIAHRVYYWIARNRHRLPGGTPECSLRSNEG